MHIKLIISIINFFNNQFFKLIKNNMKTLFMNIIEIYLARIFEQTKGRDQYIIKIIKDNK